MKRFVTFYDKKNAPFVCNVAEITWVKVNNDKIHIKVKGFIQPVRFVLNEKNLKSLSKISEDASNQLGGFNI